MIQASKECVKTAPQFLLFTAFKGLKNYAICSALLQY